MHSRSTHDKAIQTGEDLPTEAPKCQLSSNQEKLSKKSSQKAIHNAVHDHIKTLRKKHKKDLRNIYDCVEDLESTVYCALNYREGLQKALLEAYVELKVYDRDSLALFQFLEEYHERCIYFPKSYTQEMLEEDFEYGLLLALKVTDQPELFTQIYQIDTQKNLCL